MHYSLINIQVKAHETFKDTTHPNYLIYNLYLYIYIYVCIHSLRSTINANKYYLALINGQRQCQLAVGT